MHSQTPGAKPYQAWCVVDSPGSIRSAHCNCKAGLDETCSHVSAVLFAIDAGIRIREKSTPTMVKAYWMQPGKRELDAQPLHSIDFSSSKAKKRRADREIDHNAHEVISVTCSNTQPDRMTKSVIAGPTEDELSSFLHSLSVSGIKCAVLSGFEPYADAFVPVEQKKEFPVILTDLADPKNFHMNYTDLLRKCNEINITVSAEASKNVKAETRDQSKSKMWFRYRAGRVTSSRLGAVCKTNPAMPAMSLIKCICYPDILKFSSQATRWGCCHEKEAIEIYTAQMMQTHENIKVEKSGLVLNTMYPFFGSSPDGIVNCSCHGKGCVEVKCPYCKRGQTIDKAATDPQFYLQKSDSGELELRKTQLHVLLPGSI
ncbi:uncharacterized protein LOC119719909 [Patiria miniata]|uniref:YqaJ viral recombinase domain-containing protein n=1 Tax=Patiria miniata TaxID=46514 RepID=A0A913Z055_PATMI|nr:uncharacterized protein LOC119719909 [Patiria miniata]